MLRLRPTFHHSVRSALLFGLVVLSVQCSPAHVQEEGCYAMTVTEIIRDDCHLLDKSPPEALWDGSLSISGEVVRMNYGLLDMQLIGRFLVNSERFSLDGSVANATAVANGQECLLDLVSVHMDAATRSSTEFSGTIDVNYETRRPDQCVCQLWASFQAVAVSQQTEGCIRP